MNTIVVYRSKTGFTKRYAEQIASALGCEALPLRDASCAKLSGCKLVIFGSRVHAGRLDALKKAQALFAQSGAEKLFLFATGAAPATAEDVIGQMWQNNLSPEERETLPHFYMQSGLCYEKMGLPDRLLMKLAAKMMAKAKDKDAVATGFEQAIQGSFDASSGAYVEPLLAAARDYLGILQPCAK